MDSAGPSSSCSHASPYSSGDVARGGGMSQDQAELSRRSADIKTALCFLSFFIHHLSPGCARPARGALCPEWGIRLQWRCAPDGDRERNRRRRAPEAKATGAVAVPDLHLEAFRR